VIAHVTINRHGHKPATLLCEDAAIASVQTGDIITMGDDSFLVTSRRIQLEQWRPSDPTEDACLDVYLHLTIDLCVPSEGT
jgi:hypothetical protein